VSIARFSWLALVVPAVLLAITACSDAAARSRPQAAAERVLAGLNERSQAIGSQVGNEIFIRIFKEESELEVWIAGDSGKAFKLFRTYPICTFSGELGPKTKEGDLQAPEGIYEVRRQQMNPASRFHLSFNLGYPNAYERARGYTGSALMVHGDCVSIGCYAMTDAKIEQIYTLLDQYFQRHPKGVVRVHAFPFRMHADKMKSRQRHRAAAFWRELAPIYQAFEADQVPPRITIGRTYTLLAN
jgi:murein L,D-transpeptidase YafK